MHEPTLLQTLQPRETDLGGGMRVRRLLPAAQRRAVGPFVFFDHFGPVEQDASTQQDVRPHPHIGLATVTYLFEGAMMHRDSLGTVQRIEPGAINWMTAGRGIVHSERTPDDLRDKTRRLHGLQLWVALPRAEEDSAPDFGHTPAEALPELQQQDARVRVLVGHAFGAKSPVSTLVDALYLDIALPAGGTLNLPVLAPEQALYVLDDGLSAAGAALVAHTLVVCPAGLPVLLQARAAARCVLVGGAPLDGPRHLWWNFVASDKARITAAAEAWDADQFDKVPGDTERIPLPLNRPI
jgi:redox-sensitive bicupin YhaK (pirin superfamily)